MSSLNRRFSTALLASLFMTGCSNFDDDAGETAFVDRLVPTLLGRRVHNSTELRVLAEITHSEGREAVVDLLLQDPDFEAYWAQVLLDDLLLIREGTVEQSRDCFDVQHLSAGGQIAVAQGVLTGAPDTPLVDDEATFTLADVVAGSLSSTVDSIAPIYIAYLPALWAVDAEVNGDGDIADAAVNRLRTANRFTEVYLGRDMDCVSCHSSSYSVSDLHSGEDRTSIAYDLDHSVFGYTEFAGWSFQGRYGGQPSDTHLTHLSNTFRQDVLTSSGGATPWGIDSTCVSNASASGYQALGMSEVASDSTNHALIGRLARSTNSAWELVDGLQDGVNSFDWRTEAAFPEAMTTLSIRQANTFAGRNNCEGCHGNETAEERTQRYSDGKLLQAALAHDAMASSSTSYDDAIEWTHNVRQVFGNYNGDVPEAFEDHSSGFAYAVAQHVVNNVWEEVTGTSLLLDHGFSRNVSQRVTLQELTEHFIESNWSLRALLREMALHPAANIQSPAASAQDPYWLPSVLNPWISRSDYTVEFEGNSLGDAVHRRSVPALLFQLNGTLGWPRPRVFDTQAQNGSAWIASYPEMETMYGLGRRKNDEQLAVNTATFDTYYAWELMFADGLTPSHVRCGDTPSECVFSGQVDPDKRIWRNSWSDWPGVLTTTLNAQPDMVMRDVLSIVRDRVLGNGSMSSAEADLASEWLIELPSQCQPTHNNCVDDLSHDSYVHLQSAVSCEDLNPTLSDVLDLTWGEYTSWLAYSGCIDGAPNGAGTYALFSDHALAPHMLLRRYAGLLTSTPDYYLMGLPFEAHRDDLVAPALDVCLPDEPCGYEEVCADYADRLSAGHTFSCSP